MKLHKSVIAKLIRIYELHGGRRDEKRLLDELTRLDLAPYKQKENPKQGEFLVLTEDLKPKPR